MRKLPHWHPEDRWIFVNWRLAGSEPRMPATVTKTLSSGQRFVVLDNEADKAPTGPKWLADPRIAELVQRKITQLGETLYDLAAWVIMANHVHLLILPKIPIARIMQKLKGSTAYEANLVLMRTGAFWKDESYDHWIRSEDEFGRIVRYVGRNPVKAGLVDEIQLWPWSSARQTKVCHTKT